MIPVWFRNFINKNWIYLATRWSEQKRFKLREVPAIMMWELEDFFFGNLIEALSLIQTFILSFAGLHGIQSNSDQGIILKIYTSICFNFLHFFSFFFSFFVNYHLRLPLLWINCDQRIRENICLQTRGIPYNGHGWLNNWAVITTPLFTISISAIKLRSLA